MASDTRATTRNNGALSRARQRALLRELDSLMRDERMEEGDMWFVVATQWWDACIGSARNDTSDDDDNTDDGDEGMSERTAQSSKVTNELLVDLAFSSKKRKSVVLKPMLAEGRDYRLVSESVWNRLSHEFGYDWEIAREVIEWGPTNKLRVEVYPVMFQVFRWHNGMEVPEEAVDDRERPLVLVSSESSPLMEVQEQIWKAMKPALRQFAPQATKVADLARIVHVCYREAETAPWLPLLQPGTRTTAATSEPQRVSFQSAAAAVRSDANSAPLAKTTVCELELEQRDFREGTARFHHLLVETRFSNTVDPMDWRNGKFWSEIQANAWRFELVIGQLIDALDSDKKWYESRVIDLDDKSAKVHYRGWTAKWDEWIVRTSDRLAPLHTRVRNWRAFQVGDSVQVGFAIPHKNFPEWKNGVVTEVKRSGTDDKLEIKVRIDNKDLWRDAQDELLCAPDTHRAVNAIVKPAAPAAYSSIAPASSSYGSYSYNRYGRDSSVEYGRGKPDVVGVVGLQNLGNTCFMNSMLQCLINTPPLKAYFLDRDAVTNAPAFQRDINCENPLGMKGMIALEFAELVRKMWGGEYAVVSPTKLKAVIGRYAPQFAGYQQQDSQEVMNFLLDGLHEDLNRVKQKPYIPAIEANGRDDVVVAQEEWDAYRRRNDSVIVDNFMGQLRSHLTCSNPDCGHESVTFDPFMSLSVPLPTDDAVTIQVQLFWADGRIPMKYALTLPKDASTLRDVKTKLSALSAIPVARLFFVEVWKHRILRALDDAKPVDDLPDDDTLHAYELEVPVSEYEFSSKSIHPPVAGGRMSLKMADPSPATPKAMRLVALLHQAPCASPINSVRFSTSTSNGSASGESSADAYGAKQRRVEVELFNTPLLVSIPQDCSKADVHRKVWQIVKRLVATRTDAPDAFGCGDGQSLPYRLHVTQPNGATSIVRDVARSDEPANLPDPADRTHCFTVEWSRHGYHEGYDERSAKRIDLHESMKRLHISGSDAKRDVTLLQCLSKFTEREQLGESDTWYCPKCRDHVRAFKKFDLFALPRVVIFQLKRFRYAQSSFYMHRDKLSTLVTFPIDGLDLSDYVIGPQRHGTATTPLLYDLYAVSEHSGGLGGGHYTAVAKHPDNARWFSFNDSFTSETTAAKAVTSRAYVLFYVRRDATSAPGAAMAAQQ